jgi:2-polyprenyl-3-methyl-5-hydroxy-6-metoxy-1,4-benzoquinol methylase
MNHLSYYNYQSQARGVFSLEDIRRITGERRYLYDQIVLPWLPAKKQCAIVELACGHGSFLCWMKDHGYDNIVGIDSCEEQTALAAKVGASITTEDAITWIGRQPDASLDILVAIDFAEHISKDDFMDVLHHSKRLLKPGGKLILRLPNGGSPLVGINLFNDITHVWTYTPNCLATLGRMHGFSSVQFEDESTSAIRDHRWFKVPLSRAAKLILSNLFMAATKERIQWWSPHLWACLIKGS